MRLRRSIAWTCGITLVALVYAALGQPNGKCGLQQVCSQPVDQPEKDDRGNRECGPDQVCSGSISHGSVELKKKPNIVMILLDDIGYNDVGWNNRKFHTPYMNKLAEEGVILTNHYSLPVCTPSRVAFLSGYHASRAGLQRGVLGLLEPYGIPTKFKLLPQALKEQDYTTHALGKWHVGYCAKEYTPMQRGFDTFFGFLNGAEENYKHCNRKDTYFSGANCSYYDFRDNLRKGSRYGGEFSALLHSQRATTIIERHNTRNPLFMYLALSHTHFPLQAPDENCTPCQHYRNQPRKKMCCAMAIADSVVANVTEALKRRRMYDNTIIVVASDNGGSVHFGGNNYPYKGNKGSLWEGGSRTPAFVHSPLLKKKGYKNKSLFHITDWYPTFVRLAGGKIDRDMDGYDQWRTLNLNKKSDRNEILYNLDNITGTWYAGLRVGDWKLVIAPPESQKPNYVVSEEETSDESFNVPFLIDYTTLKAYAPDTTRVFLYNLAADPRETINLADDPKHQQKLEEMRGPKLRYYIQVMKPAIKMAEDPAGSPEKDDGWYWVGWCRRYVDVPERMMYSDLLTNWPPR